MANVNDRPDPAEPIARKLVEMLNARNKARQTAQTKAIVEREATPEELLKVQTKVVWEPLPVFGYTNQPSDRVAVVNANKTYEEKVLRLLDDIAKIDGVDMRWLAIGKTHIEQGWMAVNRAIAHQAG